MGILYEPVGTWNCAVKKKHPPEHFASLQFGSSKCSLAIGCRKKAFAIRQKQKLSQLNVSAGRRAQLKVPAVIASAPVQLLEAALA